MGESNNNFETKESFQATDGNGRRLTILRKSTRTTLTGKRKTLLFEQFLALECEKELEKKRTTYDAKTREYKKRDDKDVRSNEPSYTKFMIPYEVQCKMRYIQAKDDMANRFRQELKLLEIFQPTAYEAARYNRHVAITTLWPPLHNRREIARLGKFFERSSPERKRIQFLINNLQH